MDFTSLNFWLWVAQILLAALYGFAGFTKSTRPIPDLAKMMKWPGDVPTGLTRFVGVAEVLGAIGLIVPAATGILPWLTTVAAIGLSIIQVLAIGFHARRGEMVALPINLVLLALSLFIAWGRWGYFSPA